MRTKDRAAARPPRSTTPPVIHADSPPATPVGRVVPTALGPKASVVRRRAIRAARAALHPGVARAYRPPRVALQIAGARSCRGRARSTGLVPRCAYAAD